MLDCINTSFQFKFRCNSACLTIYVFFGKITNVTIIILFFQVHASRSWSSSPAASVGKLKQFDYHKNAKRQTLDYSKNGLFYIFEADLLEISSAKVEIVTTTLVTF